MSESKVCDKEVDYLEVAQGSRSGGNKEHQTVNVEQPQKDVLLMKLLLQATGTELTWVL